MMRCMKHRLIMTCGALVAWLAAPLSVMAQDEREPLDARLEGYATNVTLDSGSTGLTWVLFIVLALLALGGLFKDAKRTHLD
jgi:hypothetical protein